MTQSQTPPHINSKFVTAVVVYCAPAMLMVSTVTATHWIYTTHATFYLQKLCWASNNQQDTKCMLPNVIKAEWCCPLRDAIMHRGCNQWLLSYCCFSMVTNQLAHLDLRPLASTWSVRIGKMSCLQKTQQPTWHHQPFQKGQIICNEIFCLFVYKCWIFISRDWNIRCMDILLHLCYLILENRMRDIMFIR